MPNDDERELARCAGAGDVLAFSHLVRAHESALRSRLRILAGDMADDLAQETFMAAWRGAASWRQQGSYRSWLFSIAWRRFLSYRRAYKATEPLDAAEEFFVPPSAGVRTEISQALGRLGERERMAALLCFAEGYSHSEAAGVMGVPLGTLKSLVARARSGLVQCLESEHDCA